MNVREIREMETQAILDGIEDKLCTFKPGTPSSLRR